MNKDAQESEANAMKTRPLVSIWKSRATNGTSYRGACTQIIETELSVVKQVRRTNLLKQRGLSIDSISRDPNHTSYIEGRV
jgi:hypothetical protein